MRGGILILVLVVLSAGCASQPAGSVEAPAAGIAEPTPSAAAARAEWSQIFADHFDYPTAATPDAYRAEKSFDVNESAQKLRVTLTIELRSASPSPAPPISTAAYANVTIADPAGKIVAAQRSPGSTVFLLDPVEGDWTVQYSGSGTARAIVTAEALVAHSSS